MPSSTQAPSGAKDALMPLDSLPWGKDLMAGVVNVLDQHGIPSLLWGDSVLVALDKPTALGVSPNPSLQSANPSGPFTNQRNHLCRLSTSSSQTNTSYA